MGLLEADLELALTFGEGRLTYNYKALHRIVALLEIGVAKTRTGKSRSTILTMCHVRSERPLIHQKRGSLQWPNKVPQCWEGMAMLLRMADSRERSEL
jgi:hypothetical protein